MFAKFKKQENDAEIKYYVDNEENYDIIGIIEYQVDFTSHCKVKLNLNISLFNIKNPDITEPVALSKWPSQEQ